MVPLIYHFLLNTSSSSDDASPHFGLKCGIRDTYWDMIFGPNTPEYWDMFGQNTPESKICPDINESNGVWTWESFHPYSQMGCCLKSFKCPNPTDQIHFQIKSYFGIKTSPDNPNICEVMGLSTNIIFKYLDHRCPYRWIVMVWIESWIGFFWFWWIGSWILKSENPIHDPIQYDSDPNMRSKSDPNFWIGSDIPDLENVKNSTKNSCLDSRILWKSLIRFVVDCICWRNFWNVWICITHWVYKEYLHQRGYKLWKVSTQSHNRTKNKKFSDWLVLQTSEIGLKFDNVVHAVKRGRHLSNSPFKMA